MDQHPVRTRPPWLQCSVQLLARGVLIGLLVVPVTLALPATVKVALAAPLEDCDADGFDDATGVAVPWAGFDETRGDTPAGPGTADWWIEQNKQPGTTTDDGASAGGTSGGSTSDGGGGTSATGSGKKTTTTAAPAVAANAPVVAAVAADPNAAAAAAVDSAVASATPSTVASASAESSNVAAGAGVSDTRGSTGGNGDLWEALTVGFTGANEELFAGLGLLAALALAGGLALGVSALRGLRRGSYRRAVDTQHREELSADVA